MALTDPGPDEARAAFVQFEAPASAAGGAATRVSLEPHTAGLIHRSWLVSVGQPGSASRYLLQRLNRYVFHHPEDVLANMLRITGHLRERLLREGVSPEEVDRRVLSFVPTRSGAAGHVDARGETWRLLRFIEGTRTATCASSTAEARETARAFGGYARRLADLPPPPLHETIPGFHDTGARVEALEQAVGADDAGRAAGCRAEIHAALDRRALATVLAGPAQAPRRLRPVHNDAKVANVLFDAGSGEALVVVDLDTTMPGLCAHDFGDLVRSAVSDSAEDERDLERVSVRRPVFAALAEGYLAGIADAITPAERAQLVSGALVIAYEQAVRFLTDHVAGDRYYRIERPGHNLDRARNQLRLVESLESVAPELERLVAAAAAG